MRARYRSSTSPAIIARYPGGCVFAEDPSRPPRQARLFWDAALDPRVIVARARRTHRSDPERFDPFGLSVPVIILCDGNQQELLLGEGSRSVRISVAEGSVLEGPVTLRYDLGGTDALDLRLLALRRLASLLIRTRLPGHLFAPHARARRWARLVDTIEALALDPSHRSVAARLFGEAVASAEWNGADPRDVPGWARAMKAQASARHHRQAAVHALAQGDRGGAPAAPDIKERED